MRSITAYSPSLLERVLIKLRVIRPWCDRPHAWRETHGDQRNYIGARWVCCYCPARGR